MLIYKGEHQPIYAQVALFDAEDPYSWPLSQTGEQDYVIGPKGIAIWTVPVIRNIDVEVLVYMDQDERLVQPLVTTTIEVGSEGLLVGTDAGTDVSHIPLPKGTYIVSAYVNAHRNEVTQVIFRLRQRA